MSEALKRAEAYHKAGADALLVHSKKNTAEDIFEFMKEWKDTCPVVIVPTMYYNTPTDEFQDCGVSLVIWANHLLRARIKAMQHTATQIYKDRALTSVENEIVSVKEVFRLQNADELKKAEKVYLPSQQ